MQGKRKCIPDGKVQGLYRVVIEDSDSKKLIPPVRGKKYKARKRRGKSGKQQEQWFDLRDEAIRWLREEQQEVSHEAVATVGSDKGMTVEELWEKFLLKRRSLLRPSTLVRYQNLFRLYFDSLKVVGVRELTPATVDQWLDELKSPESWTSKSQKRLSFKHELDLLRTLLSFYDEYMDDSEFRMPIKRRHYRDCMLRESVRDQNKDLLPEEFALMIEQLSRQPMGRLLVALASAQYWHALRISEAAGLCFEDIRIDTEDPKKSFLRVRNSVHYPRKKGQLPTLQKGFKNSKKGMNQDGVKVSRLLPQAYDALKAVRCENGRGPIFTRDGELWTYKFIYNAYRKALKKAGLEYTGTHVLRHGGTRAVLNETGDLTLAQQHLGNSSLSATQVYAQRSSTAWDEFVMSEWNRVGAEPMVEEQMRGKSEK